LTINTVESVFLTSTLHKAFNFFSIIKFSKIIFTYSKTVTFVIA